MHLGFFFTNYVMLVGGIKDGLELLNKACDVKDSERGRGFESHRRENRIFRDGLSLQNR